MLGLPTGGLPPPAKKPPKKLPIVLNIPPTPPAPLNADIAIAACALSSIFNKSLITLVAKSPKLNLPSSTNLSIALVIPFVIALNCSPAILYALVALSK